MIDGHHHQQWGADKRMQSERLQIASLTDWLSSGLLFYDGAISQQKQQQKVP